MGRQLDIFIWGDAGVVMGGVLRRAGAKALWLGGIFVELKPQA